MILEHFY